MPIYEYRCGDCGHIFDALQKISDDPLKSCPECNEPALKKLLSAPKFRLKGSGWYETDFKTGDKRNLADGSSKTPASGGSSKSPSSGGSSKSSNSSKSSKKAANGD